MQGHRGGPVEPRGDRGAWWLAGRAGRQAWWWGRTRQPGAAPSSNRPHFVHILRRQRDDAIEHDQPLARRTLHRATRRRRRQRLNVVPAPAQARLDHPCNTDNGASAQMADRREIAGSACARYLSGRSVWPRTNDLGALDRTARCGADRAHDALADRQIWAIYSSCIAGLTFSDRSSRGHAGHGPGVGSPLNLPEVAGPPPGRRPVPEGARSVVDPAPTRLRDSSTSCSTPLCSSSWTTSSWSSAWSWWSWSSSAPPRRRSRTRCG